MFLIGFFATIGHLLLILSLKYANASKLAPYGYFEIVPNIIIGYYFFNNLPDTFNLVGLFVIILSGLYLFRRDLNNAWILMITIYKYFTLIIIFK